MLDVGSLLPFGSGRITTMKVVFGNSGTLPLSFFAPALSQICRRSLVASPSLLPHLLNLTYTFYQKHLHPLLPNPFSIIASFQWQPGLESLQKISNGYLPVQRSISQLFQTVLSRDNRPILPLKKPSHPYFLPLVEGTKVGLPHPFVKLLQGEFRLLQASWGFAFTTAQVQRMIALSICIGFVIRNFW
jgi:hypothetical protein